MSYFMVIPFIITPLSCLSNKLFHSDFLTKIYHTFFIGEVRLFKKIQSNVAAYRSCIHIQMPSIARYHYSIVHMTIIFQGSSLHNAHMPLEREYHINSTWWPNQTLVTKTNQKVGSFTTVMKMNCGNYVRKTSITLGVITEFSVQ